MAEPEPAVSMTRLAPPLVLSTSVPTTAVLLPSLSVALSVYLPRANTVVVVCQLKTYWLPSLRRAVPPLV